MARLVLRIAVVLAVSWASACGSAPDEEYELLQIPFASNRFCGDVDRFLELIQDRKIERAEAEALARRFAEDQQALARVRDERLASLASAFATGLRRLDLDAILRALRSVPPEVCGGAQDFAWRADGPAWAELRVPADWQHYAEDWRLPGKGVVGASLRAGLHMTRGAQPAGEDARWILPTAFLGVSRSLADDLGVADGRTAVAVDRIRAWMERERPGAGCRLHDTRPYAKGIVWGFVRRWDGCGGVGASLVEVYAVGLHREPDASVVVLRLTGRLTGHIPTLQQALESFHLIH